LGQGNYIPSTQLSGIRGEPDEGNLGLPITRGPRRLYGASEIQYPGGKIRQVGDVSKKVKTPVAAFSKGGRSVPDDIRKIGGPESVGQPLWHIVELWEKGGSIDRTKLFLGGGKIDLGVRSKGAPSMFPAFLGNQVRNVSQKKIIL